MALTVKWTAKTSVIPTLQTNAMRNKIKNGLIALLVTVLMGSVSACDLFELTESGLQSDSQTESVSSETVSVGDSFESGSQEQENSENTPTSDTSVETPDEGDNEDNSEESAESIDSEEKEEEGEVVPPTGENSASEDSTEDDGTIELPEIEFD